jgi:predicted nuclease of restriction endonuclease-like RecB superfamily
MSDWINFRDNSIFNETKGITVKSICKPNNLQLLQTIVHETSHVYDYHMHITPYTDSQLTIFKTSDTTPFIDNVWDSYYKPVKEYDFPNRGNISFYGLRDKRIDRSCAPELYKDLLNTPFSSVYGARSWGEDFAESFTWFYLEKRFGIEYTVSVYKDRTLIVEFSPSKNKRVEQRSRILEELMD